MHSLFKLIKFIFFIPIVVLASPGLILMFATIFVVEDEEGKPIRYEFMSDISKKGFVKGFTQFMQDRFIKMYKNNIQGFVVGAAGFLVVAVGLRSLGILPTEVVYVALGIEFTLLLVYGTAMYFTKSEGTGADQTPEEALA
ncbi:MAG TPA: hypothetical protein VKS81_03370, partial [Bacteroidota bacterium]|nr:hypothetical protein [Bacteroidota bacterium]